MKRVEMVRRGGAKLIVAENAIEAAIRDVAGLTCELSDMRLTSGLSALYGQDAMQGLGEAMTALTEARGRMIEVHKALDRVKTGIGCATVMDGPISKPGDTGDDAVIRLPNVA